MNRTILAGLAGTLVALTAGPAVAQAAPVTIRVEGATANLVKETQVDPASVGALTRAGTTCNGTNTAAGALELATGGDWDGEPSFGSVFVNRIKAETYTLQDNRYWSLLINDVPAGFGACDQPVQSGDEVVFAVGCSGATADCVDEGSLAATGAPTATPGEAYAVTATQVATTYGNEPPYAATTTRAPAAGATVAGGGATATATAGADGVARIGLTQRGPVELTVTKGRAVRDQVRVCVTDGADGFCGTRRPDGTTLPPEVGGAPAAPAVPDSAAPVASVAGIKNGQRFSRKRAPRELKATVADASRVLQVKLSLTRQVGKRCWAFSGKTERFKRITCGRHPVFKVDGTTDVSYLLPKRLGKGRYVLDVRATDAQYNRDELARGRNRVVFSVR